MDDSPKNPRSPGCRMAVEPEYAQLDLNAIRFNEVTESFDICCQYARKKEEIMKNSMIVGFVALLLVLTMPLKVIADDVFVCDSFDDLGANDVPDDAEILVPLGGVCILDGTLDGIIDIGDDVTVSESAVFIAFGARIDGDVTADGAGVVWLLQDLPEPSPDAILTEVDGDVELRNTTGFSSVFGPVDPPIAICESVIDGELEIEDSVGDGTNMLGDFAFCFLGVEVDDDVSIFNNINAGGILISNNVIDGDLECAGNDPEASGEAGSNIVDGDVVGECIGLAASGESDDDDDDD